MSETNSAMRFEQEAKGIVVRGQREQQIVDMKLPVDVQDAVLLILKQPNAKEIVETMSSLT